jgi:predicted phosphodiesterase
MKKIIAFSDVHLPYMDLGCWQLLQTVIKAEQPDILIANGDIFDMDSFSDHLPDLKKGPRDGAELHAGQYIWRKFCEDVLPCVGKAHFVEGNHEAFLWRWLATHAPHLAGVTRQYIKLAGIFDGWKVHEYGDYFNLGRLYVTHDVGACGDTSGVAAYNSFHRNIITGHSHRLSLVTRGTVTGERHASMVLGCLCDMAEMRYMPRVKRNNWQHGFGVIMEGNKGDLTMCPIPIITTDGVAECVVNGKSYDSELKSTKKGKKK